jgi:uncharacterized protein YjbI with pentapeptide repeats
VRFVIPQAAVSPRNLLSARSAESPAQELAVDAKQRRQRMMVGQQVEAMANPKHLAKLREGAVAWNRWRQEHPKVKPDVSKADLSSLDLNSADTGGANFVGANLSGANLSSARLMFANFWSASLAGADLAKAWLHFASFSGANLSGANLTEAKAFGASFDHAGLETSNMSRIDLHATSFGDNDLSTVKGLDCVEHSGPCSIGIDTIYRSKGNIPESFLRGCGVPDEFITYAKVPRYESHPVLLLLHQLFHQRPAFADRLYADLQNKGVRCWFAPHDVQGGRKLHEQIDEAIRLHDKLLLILSPHSMESEWVKTEIAKARKREVRDPEGVLKRRVLFPIRLAPFATLRDWECFDADTGKDSAREIREYFIPDFSNWKNHDSYQEAFQRLISDLKASDSKPKYFLMPGLAGRRRYNLPHMSVDADVAFATMMGEVAEATPSKP